MADGINPIANLLGKTDANNALLVAISGSIPAASFPLLAPDGTAAAPSYAFSGHTGDGMFYSSGLAFADAGNMGMRLVYSSNFGLGLDKDLPLSWGSTGIASLDLFLYRQGPANLIQKNGATAQRLDVANTYTSASNNELFSVDWQTTANTLAVGSRTAATGTARTTWFAAQGANAATFAFGTFIQPTGAPRVSIGVKALDGITSISTGTVGIEMVRLGDFTSTATSGTTLPVTITPTYNQSSGNAANTDLLINRTQTAVGSGAQLLIDAQVGGVSKFSVDNTGLVTAGADIRATGDFNVPSASRWRLTTNGQASLLNNAGTAGIVFGSTGIANGQSFNDIQALTELTTIAAAASTDTTIQMPANAVVLAVSVRVTVVIPTAATFTVGDSGSAARFSTAAVSVAANSTDPGTKAGAYYNAGALSVRITPNATPGANSGRVRVTIYYYTVTPPTS